MLLNKQNSILSDSLTDLLYINSLSQPSYHSNYIQNIIPGNPKENLIKQWSCLLLYLNPPLSTKKIKITIIRSYILIKLV